jgi:hypothetical protein
MSNFKHMHLSFSFSSGSFPSQNSSESLSEEPDSSAKNIENESKNRDLRISFCISAGI